MVEVDDGVTVETRLEQEFNGLSWRTLKREDLDADGDLDEERTYTYTANWQLIEERVDKDIDSDLDKRVQYVWGLRYIDDCLMHRADLDNNGEYDDTNENTWYHMTDGMFSTVALLDRAANLVERVSYDSYGKARHHRGGDLDGDGKVDGSDQGDLMGVWDTVITDSGYRGDADFNRDGEIDGNDLGSLFGFWGAALPAGQISFTTTGGPDNSIGWDGYVFNPATGDYLVRYRTYSPTLGRWAERDPLGYRDGASLVDFGRSQPISRSDPTGLVTVLVHGILSQGEWYQGYAAGLRAAWGASECDDIIGFTWQSQESFDDPRPTIEDSADSVGNFTRTNTVAARRLAALLKALEDLHGRHGCEEPINVAAHSAGTVVTIAAAQQGAMISNSVFMGSCLDAEHGIIDVCKAGARLGAVSNYYFTTDWIALARGGAFHWSYTYTASGATWALPTSVRNRPMWQGRELDFVSHTSYHTPERARSIYAPILDRSGRGCCDCSNEDYRRDFEETIAAHGAQRVPG